MLPRFVALVAALLSAFAIEPAAAYWDPPFITPGNPGSDEGVSINVHMGVCDAIFSTPGYPQITQTGNGIHIVVFGQHWEPGDLCSYGEGTASFPLGSYAPGNYSVVFDLRYVDFFSQLQALTLGTTEFSVRGLSTPVTVPAMSRWAMLVFAFAIVIAGMLKLRSAVPHQRTVSA